MKQQVSRVIFLFRKACVNIFSTTHNASVMHPEAALEKQYLQSSDLCATVKWIIIRNPGALTILPFLFWV